MSGDIEPDVPTDNGDDLEPVTDGGDLDERRSLIFFANNF